MLVVTLGDVFGIILLGLAIIYCLYIFIRGSVIRHDSSKGGAKTTAKAEPKKLLGVLETKNPVSNKKSDPRVLKSLVVIGLLFIIAIALALLVAKK